MKKPLAKFIALSAVLICLIGSAGIFLFVSSHTFQDHKYLRAADYFLGTNNTEIDLPRSVKTLENLAQADHAPSQCFLGFLYHKGYKTIETDKDKAFFWAHKAARKGCLLAVYQMGHWHQENARDSAADWFLPVAEWGYDNAQYNLGRLLLDKNPEDARKWLIRAAKQGHKGSMNMLQEIDPDFDPSKITNPTYEKRTSQKDLDWLDHTPDFMILSVMQSWLNYSSSS